MKFLILLLITMAIIWPSVLTFYRFTKITCEGLDENMGYFEYCRMKAVNRYVNYVSVRARLLKALPGNITFHYQMMKRGNGWKPFLYDIKLDLCKFLQLHNNPVIGILYNAIKSHINLGKRFKCPLKGTIAIENVTNSEGDDLVKNLPFPSGEYAEFLSFSVNNILKAKINVYGTFTYAIE